MACPQAVAEAYHGYEIGPLRPPSEAGSLLIRLTRNCSWNRCTFCPGYKGTRFSIRPKEHILMDIEHLSRCRDRIETEGVERLLLHPRFSWPQGARTAMEEDPMAFHAMMRWMGSGMESVFLQDGNSMMMDPEALVCVVGRIREVFPSVKRVTSFGRSGTLARMADADLAALAKAGLTHVQIGFESGSDRVLAELRKGATRAQHETAAQKLTRAGIRFSVYLLWGAGGRLLSAEHASESADLVNIARPETVRMVTLSFPPKKALFFRRPHDYQPASETGIVSEIREFLTRLSPGPGAVESDFVSNLLHKVRGPIAGGISAMCGAIDAYLDLPEETRDLFATGKRMGLVTSLEDLPRVREQIEAHCREMRLSPETIPAFLEAARSRVLWA